MASVTIAVDAMGGDHAPGVVVQGVAEYLVSEAGSAVDIALVGRKKEIRRELKKYSSAVVDRIRIVNAREEISMREHFFSYWRKRENTSVKKAIDLVKQNKAQAMVSVGNTGAVMALAKTGLGVLDNIDRPALSIMIPTLTGSSLLVDVGANVDPKPRNLVQFAIMGKVFLENILGIENPRIALMSIGEEEDKGNELIKKTHNMLKSMSINFIGNIEGKDAYLGVSDLIVTDGFTGNVTLKVAEGVVDVIMSMLKKEVTDSLQARVGLFFLKRSLKKVRKKLDYAETGGALLLGVNGIVVIGHGRSSSKAVCNAIDMSRKFITQKVQEKIAREMKLVQNLFKEFNYGRAN